MADRDSTGEPLRFLDSLTRDAERIQGVRKMDLEPGDRVVVSTRNSVYSLVSRGGDKFIVAGGWFEQRGVSPSEMRVSGCTVGGTALLRRLVAAPGLFLEFGNGVRTTCIRSVRVMRAAHS